MICVSRKRGPFLVSHIYFAKDAQAALASEYGSWRLARLVQCTQPVDGFQPFKTLVMDLCQEEDILFEQVNKNCRYKIKRAESKDRAFCSFIDAPNNVAVDRFLALNENFARSKGISTSYDWLLRQLAETRNLFLSFATVDEQVVSAHAYVADHDSSRMRLLSSASTRLDSSSSSDANQIGRINRYLHWFDMMQAKARGVLLYDWGGWGNRPGDASTRGITEFKASFGGRELVEYQGIIGRGFAAPLAVRIKRWWDMQRNSGELVADE